jgi:uncharacterized DUF497 family protein
MYYIYNVMGERIELEYDDEKNRRNIAERGLPFDLGEFVLTDPNVATECDNRKDYGEKRFLSYGKVGGLRLCLCWTPRNGRVRVITLFKVHEKEWEKHYGKDD